MARSGLLLEFPMGVQVSGKIRATREQDNKIFL